MSTSAAIHLVASQAEAPSPATRSGRGLHFSDGIISYNWRAVPLRKMALVFGPQGKVIEAYGPGAPISPAQMKRAKIVYYNAGQLRAVLNR